MIKTLTPELVEQLVVSGLQEANRRYSELSGGEWITTRGVESFLAYFVAKRFAKYLSSKKISIRLEVSRTEFERDYIQGLRLHGLRGSRLRFDLVLVRKEGKEDHRAIGLIELKREDPDKYPKGYYKDIKRLASIVGSCRELGVFQFGCFAGVDSENEGERWLRKLRLKWMPKMQAEADKNEVKVKIFSSLKRNYERVAFHDQKKRYDIIGCVFYNYRQARPLHRRSKAKAEQ